MLQIAEKKITTDDHSRNVVTTPMKSKPDLVGKLASEHTDNSNETSEISPAKKLKMKKKTEKVTINKKVNRTSTKDFVLKKGRTVNRRSLGPDCFGMSRVVKNKGDTVKRTKAKNNVKVFRPASELQAKTNNEKVVEKRRESFEAKVPVFKFSTPHSGSPKIMTTALNVRTPNTIKKFSKPNEQFLSVTESSESYQKSIETQVNKKTRKEKKNYINDNSSAVKHKVSEQSKVKKLLKSKDVMERLEMKKPQSTPKGINKSSVTDNFGMKRLKTPKSKMQSEIVGNKLGLKRLLQTPKNKVINEAVDENFGTKRLYQTPKLRVKVDAEVKEKFGIKRLLKTPKEKVIYSQVAENFGMNRLLKIPKLKDAGLVKEKFGTKRLLQTPKQKVKYEEVKQKFGTKRLFLSPKDKKLSEQVNDHFGVKRLFQGDMKKEKYEEVAEKFGMKRLFQSPKGNIKYEEVKEKFGTKRLFLSPKEKVVTEKVDKYFGTKRIFSSPKKKYKVNVDENLSGVKRLMNVYHQHDSHDAVENFDSELFSSPLPPSKKSKNTKKPVVRIARITRGNRGLKATEDNQNNNQKDSVTLEDSTNNENISKNESQFFEEPVEKKRRGRKARVTKEIPKVVRKTTRNRNAPKNKITPESTSSSVVEHSLKEKIVKLDSKTEILQVEKPEKEVRAVASKVTRSKRNLKPELLVKEENKKSKIITLKNENKLINNIIENSEVVKKPLTNTRVTRKRKAVVDKSVTTSDQFRSKVPPVDAKLLETSNVKDISNNEIIEVKSNRPATVKRTTRKRKVEVDTAVTTANVDKKEIRATRSRRGNKKLEDTKEVCNILETPTSKQARSRKVASKSNEKTESKEILSGTLRVSKRGKKIEEVSKSIEEPKSKLRSKKIVASSEKKETIKSKLFVYYYKMTNYLNNMIFKFSIV